MSKAVRVGIIGASAGGGWARDSHVPAVQALGGLELAAVATNSRTTADAAAQAFGVQTAYGSGLELIHATDIDLVAVCTRVPDHRDLVLAALTAGKHVYCEWPLGRSVDEAEEMAAAAGAAGVHAAIGLQLRASPVVRHAREAVAAGTIGRVLSASAYSSTAGFGPDVPAPFLYLEDPDTFANLITIQGAHTVDLALATVGPLAEMGTLLTTQYPEIRAGDGGETRERVTFDHLLFQGRLAAGAALSVEVAGGRHPETPFYLDIVGERGIHRLDGGAARGLQSGPRRLSRDGAPESVDEGELADLPDAAVNVGGVYAALRDDILTGSSTATGFDHAVRLTRLAADLFRSSEAGERRSAAGWPER